MIFFSFRIIFTLIFIFLLKFKDFQKKPKFQAFHLFTKVIYLISL